MDFGVSTSGFEAPLCHLIQYFIWNRMLLFYIIFGDHNPPYPALGSNIPSARRPGQRFHFLQCRGSSPSLRFVNRHGGTIRRAGWFAFTRKVTHLPPKSLVSRPQVPTHASRCPRPTFIHSRIGWL